jgi:hypothetical protein
MELDLKEWMAERWAGINFWEQHVEWDFETWDYITIRDLDILNFSWIRLSFERLNSHQLYLNRLNLQLWVLAN